MEFLAPKQAVFLIDVETVSPLLQIEPSSKEKDKLTMASVVKTKQKGFIHENGKFEKEPFFSANGFRGIMRRNITRTIFADLEKKDGKKMSVDAIHLYSSGGGTSSNNFTNIFKDGVKLDYASMQTFREKNPFISLFGAGLSDVDGKLSVSDIQPVERGKRITDYLYGVRFDDTERSSILTPLLDSESIASYKDDISKRQSASAGLRKKEAEMEKISSQMNSLDNTSPEYKELSDALAEKKVAYELEKEEKGMSYQQVYKAEFIIPGVQMSSSIATRAGHELTDIEKAMMLHGLIETSKQNIGSYSRIGWGAMNWHIKDSDGKTLFKTTCDEKYILSRSVEISEDGKKLLSVFDAYLAELNRDSIYIPE